MNSRVNTEHLVPASESQAITPGSFSLAPDGPELPFHPLADILPRMDESEYQKLLADVATNGVHEPIWLSRGKILDGRHRWLAARAANVECKAREYLGTDPRGFVVRLNLLRRNLDKSQLALAAAELARLPVGANQHGEISAISQGDAADMFDISRELVGLARKVSDSGVPELKAAVQSKRLSVSAAAELTQLPPEEQLAALAARTAAKDAPKQPTPIAKKSSGSDEWYTPDWVIAMARSAMGEIDTDPASCAAANGVVNAKTHYTVADDGLSQQWSGRVWLNPPYSRELVDKFVEAVVEKYQSGQIEQACVLVNNATDTDWFHQLLGAASLMCVFKGRIRFWNELDAGASSPRQGQVLLYLGRDEERFKAAFGSAGAVFAPARASSVTDGTAFDSDEAWLSDEVFFSSEKALATGEDQRLKPAPTEDIPPSCEVASETEATAHSSLATPESAKAVPTLQPKPKPWSLGQKATKGFFGP